jgi:hypothetical protein
MEQIWKSKCFPVLQKFESELTAQISGSPVSAAGINNNIRLTLAETGIAIRDLPNRSQSESTRWFRPREHIGKRTTWRLSIGSNHSQLV